MRSTSRIMKSKRCRALSGFFKRRVHKRSAISGFSGYSMARCLINSCAALNGRLMFNLRSCYLFLVPTALKMNRFEKLPLPLRIVVWEFAERPVHPTARAMSSHIEETRRRLENEPSFWESDGWDLARALQRHDITRFRLTELGWVRVRATMKGGQKRGWSRLHTLPTMRHVSCFDS